MKRLFYIFVIFTCVLAFVSCKDDDSFSADMHSRLTLIDSLKFDTVFSRIPTSAKSFWIHNNSGDGIRCTNVRLKRGNQSGFRVNVDGENLGAERGYQVNGLEIRNGDSARVFVELTAKPNYVDGPQFRDEELVFQLESGAVQTVNLSAWTWDVDTVHTMTIDKDSVIGNLQRPLIIFSGIDVKPQATLTIGEGTTLYFHDNAGINVEGTLRCQGSAEKNIVLRSYRLDNMFDYLTYENAPGHWQGMHFMESSYDNEIAYTDMHGSYDGIVCDSSDVERQKLSILSSTIHNCQGYCLFANNCRVSIENSQITNSSYDCVHVLGGHVSMNQCTVAQFYGFDAMRGAALYFTNKDGDNRVPLLALDVVNSIITGYASDVIMGVPVDDEEVPFNYTFSHTLLRTPEVDDEEKFVSVLWDDTKEGKGGEKHFVKVDIDKLQYDFHLDSLSVCRGAADPQRALPLTRDGIVRDENNMNIGCY